MSTPVIPPANETRLRARQRMRLANEILGTYVLVRWSLLRHTLPEVVGAIHDLRRHSEPQPLAPVAGVRLGTAVQKMLRLLPFDSRCLIRSLVLSRMLARRGVSASVIIGVRSSPTFAAHAWVEHGGLPLLPTEQSFHRLTEL